ncbi:MAG: LacI family DNA-binding transcriptional regulator [Clostridiales bacterium]|nr:LacI family DNA-binding transcriptional regulator [Clostridiales bacterium]
MTTIQDVARHAHVGVATVSRVLNGNGYVKEETRKKIEAAIADLDYTPNEMARNLYFRKSHIVAVTVPDVSHPFFAEFVSTVEAALCEKGYQTMICNTYYESNFEEKYLEMLKRQRVDGIIFGSHTLDTSGYADLKKPIVALDRDLGGNIPCVASNHREGGRLAAEELIRAGCKKVVQFEGSVGKFQVSTPSNMRHEVFREVMESHGVTCYSYDSRWNNFRNAYFRSLVREALDQHPDIDGAFGTDMLMMEMLREARERGKRVPDELKLVAYDGTYPLQFCYPGITCVEQPIQELAREAVRLVIEMIDGNLTGVENVELPVSLRRRESTACEGNVRS